ncbi:MAG: hypothetical protein JHC84_13065 [Solirubrobacteraceae bacterium]|nr:hypothetical protein [Solirubrobacteraceae bacterium]
MDGAERTYARTYHPVQRKAVHEFLVDAVEASGGRVLFTSSPTSAPFFVASERGDGERVGVCAYVFAANQVSTRNRPSDEHRAQVRYGDVNNEAWRLGAHPLGFDPTDLDLTVVLVAHLDAGLFIALDPRAYDPLPLGNSIYFKDAQIAQAQADGWAVWERDTHGGSRKGAVGPGLETIIAFTPDRLFDFLAVERQAQTLQLDSALRFPVAIRAANERPAQKLHELEEAFQLSSTDLLDIVGRNSRLAMAVRGGVAEHHLGVVLDSDTAVLSAREGHQEGPPDYFVRMADGRDVTVECKNASPKLYADGTPKVEVQKTRASQGDPTSRYYPPAAFDVLAACMYGPTGSWTFRFRRSSELDEHPQHKGRIAPLQRITPQWSDTLAEALSSTPA